MSRDNRVDRKEPNYDLYPTVELPAPPEGVFGWIPSEPDEKERHERLFPLSDLGWKAADVVETRLYFPVTEVSNGVTTNLVTFYNQGNTGTCIGFSGSILTTVRNSTAQLAKKYNGIELYKQCRRIMGANPNDLNGGASMPSVGKALRDWGHMLVLGNANQPVSKDEGIEGYYWGTSAADARLAISQGKPAHFGIYWYQAFQSPKLINGEYWIGWQSPASWGKIMGGHGIGMIEWSDSRNAGKLKNSWGPNYPEVWISASAINELLKVKGELMVCNDRSPITPIPVGKLELVEDLTIQPAIPQVDDNIIANFVVRNSGNATLSLSSIGIRGLRNNTAVWDFGMQPLVLDIGQDVELAPKCDKPLKGGSYTFNIGYQDSIGWHNLGTPVSFTVKETPSSHVVTAVVTVDGVDYILKEA